MLNIYSDKFTGKTTNRPALNKLLNQLRNGDELVVVKLDRLARNAKEGLELIDELNNRGITVSIKNMVFLPRLTRQSLKRCFWHL
ncbi:recombinase family protein [Dellaglioa carnosa]|uniref:recombinase family protein n=1 Tax=Dellaglioa carnosa TaxID=2995136 RepID=UPI0038B2BD98